METINDLAWDIDFEDEETELKIENKTEKIVEKKILKKNMVDSNEDSSVETTIDNIYFKRWNSILNKNNFTK